VVIVGAAHKSGGVPTSRTNVKGYVRGFDVRTGKRLWIFHTIPMQGEFGYDTWEKESAVYTGNGGVWAQISVDTELETVYLPVELPTGDYFGANRPGAGLFGESIVAVDLHTGSASGITSSCITASGTTTFPVRRFLATSSSTAGRSRRSRSRRSRRSSTSSIA
jgi:glucose dehydrogenase